MPRWACVVVVGVTTAAAEGERQEWKRRFAMGGERQECARRARSTVRPGQGREPEKGGVNDRSGVWGSLYRERVYVCDPRKGWGLGG